jgi:hypothetical protein
MRKPLRTKKAKTPLPPEKPSQAWECMCVRITARTLKARRPSSAGKNRVARYSS